MPDVAERVCQIGEQAVGGTIALYTGIQSRASSHGHPVTGIQSRASRFSTASLAGFRETRILPSRQTSSNEATTEASLVRNQVTTSSLLYTDYTMKEIPSDLTGGKPDADRRLRQADRLARIMRVLQLLQSRGRWNVTSIAQ